MNEPDSKGDVVKPKRRPRYHGTHPRKFHEKYKELNPEKYKEAVERVLASGKTPAGMHRPIMVKEILEALHPCAGEIGVDCTLGYGGHAMELLKRIQPGGKLIGLDADPLEIQKTEQRLRESGKAGEGLIVRNTNFAALPRVLAELSIPPVDFILADLGVSSMQLDNPERGFSFKLDGPLDLRMNPKKGRQASEWLREITEERLRESLAASDEPFAPEIARAIVRARENRPLQSTMDLRGIIEEVLSSLSRKVREEQGDKPIRRTFQALRILVNDEFGVLEQFLRVLPECLKPGGRVAILTFHSGEDRRVKKRFQELERAGIFKSVFGPLAPSREEVHRNPRSSSAKLRWVEKNAWTEEPGTF